MRPEQVNPVAWTNHEIIYNDEGFSAVWGRFKESLCLGIRWNGDSNEERGYPGQGAYPLWFIVPEFLVLSMLERLHTTAVQGELVNPLGIPFAQLIQNAIRQLI